MRVLDNGPLIIYRIVRIRTSVDRSSSEPRREGGDLRPVGKALPCEKGYRTPLLNFCVFEPFENEKTTEYGILGSTSRRENGRGPDPCGGGGGFTPGRATLGRFTGSSGRLQDSRTVRGTGWDERYRGGRGVRVSPHEGDARGDTSDMTGFLWSSLSRCRGSSRLLPISDVSYLSGKGQDCPHGHDGGLKSDYRGCRGPDPTTRASESRQGSRAGRFKRT